MDTDEKHGNVWEENPAGRGSILGVEFRLVYQGPLAVKGNVAQKQSIRRALHPQLAALWQQLPLLDLRPFLTGPPVSTPHRVPAGGWPIASPPSLVVEVGPFKFVPLVSERLNLICHLDILFLRKEEPGAIITTGGDIDNRLKTLLDALRIPKSDGELPKNDTPQQDEDPFFALLSDDALVTQLRITTDRLLSQLLYPSHVHLILHVVVKATRTTWQNLQLIS